MLLGLLARRALHKNSFLCGRGFAVSHTAVTTCGPCEEKKGRFLSVMAAEAAAAAAEGRGKKKGGGGGGGLTEVSVYSMVNT